MMTYNFTFIALDSACIKLEVDIQTDSVVSKKNVETAKKFGVRSSDTVDPRKYIIAFLTRLLFLREKNDKNLLEACLNPKISRLWQEVLDILEDTNRKLINIQSGSLIFTLFCPKHHSLLQLQDLRWTVDLQGKMDKLLNALGMIRIFLLADKDNSTPEYN